ncbi:MAG: response regulator [Oscillospiraceae bacterium]|nr:response regulator [Oscillospiraceae bacterium]
MRKNEGKAYCYRVKGLFVPYQTPANIEQCIDHYINTIEQHTERLDDCFSRGDTGGFIHTLQAVQVLLQDVYAKQCISYINALLDAARTRGMEHSRRLLQQAIADLLLLSIDMQKAQMIGTSHALKYRKVEKNEEIARGFSALKRMITVRDYEKALNLAEDMEDMDGAFRTMIIMLKSRQYDRAGELADTMEKEHIGHIQQQSGAKSQKTVMAVDDRPDTLSNVNAALRGHYKVLGAPGGKMALEIMERQNVDLFILDIEMPEMDGFELAERIRADRVYAETPIVFLTGNASKENITKGISLGISDFIVKPSNHVNLLVKARTYMDDQQ